ncbi:hypothetical protein P8452_44210 [Trifolium repens]|nr:hypothetical protein P8452_44210 [Trifolium repens]
MESRLKTGLRFLLLISGFAAVFLSTCQGLPPCCTESGICDPIVCEDYPCCIPNELLPMPPMDLPKVPAAAGDSLDQDSHTVKMRLIFNVVLVLFGVSSCLLLLFLALMSKPRSPPIPLCKMYSFMSLQELKIDDKRSPAQSEPSPYQKEGSLECG